MTPQEIESGNEVIATFMGCIFSEQAMKWGMDKACWKPLKLKGGGEVDMVWASRWEAILKYHEDWNWLMPVVEQIESLVIVDEVNIRYDSVSKGHYVEITPSYNDSFKYISTGIIKNKIEAIYKAVTMFAKWHNDNTKKS